VKKGGQKKMDRRGGLIRGLFLLLLPIKKSSFSKVQGLFL